MSREVGAQQLGTLTAMTENLDFPASIWSSPSNLHQCMCNKNQVKAEEQQNSKSRNRGLETVSLCSHGCPGTNRSACLCLCPLPSASSELKVFITTNRGLLLVLTHAVILEKHNLQKSQEKRLKYSMKQPLDSVLTGHRLIQYAVCSAPRACCVFEV